MSYSVIGSTTSAIYEFNFSASTLDFTKSLTATSFEQLRVIPQASFSYDNGTITYIYQFSRIIPCVGPSREAVFFSGSGAITGPFILSFTVVGPLLWLLRLVPSTRSREHVGLCPRRGNATASCRPRGRASIPS